MTLEPKQKTELENWIEEVREHEHSALKWAALLFKIKQSGFWKATHTNWPDFCHDTFGYSRDKAYRYVACGETLEENKEDFAQNPPKSLRDVRTRKKVANAPQPKFEYVGTENDKEEKTMATARKAPDEEVGFKTPEPMPVVVEIPKATVTIPIWNEVHAICNYVNQLQQKDSRYMEPAFRKLVGMLKDLERHMQMPLPGILEQVPEKTPARGSQKELEAYCVSQDLKADDGAWLYDKMLVSGWKNDGKPIKDWQALVRAWKRINIFPSQKQAALSVPPASSKPKGWTIDKEIARAKKDGVI